MRHRLGLQGMGWPLSTCLCSWSPRYPHNMLCGWDAATAALVVLLVMCMPE